MPSDVEVLGCRREFPERNYERCGKPAGWIVWGKLFPREALGPRCRSCLEDQCGHRAPTDPAYAIYKLPDLPAIRKQAIEAERERLRGLARWIDNQQVVPVAALEETDRG